MRINTTSGEGLTILVVDEDRTTADVVLRCIDRDQLFRLIEVTTAEEALEVLTRPHVWQAPRPNLVLISGELYTAHTVIFKSALLRASIPPMRTVMVGEPGHSGSYSRLVLSKPVRDEDVVALIEQLYRDMARAGYSARKGRVFLSHSSGDKEQVRTLYHRLMSDALPCWFDEEDLLGGHDWDFEISRAIRESRIFLACLSYQSVNKEGYVQTELKKALDVADRQPENAVYILPVRLEECVVPSRLSRWQCVDLFGDGGYERLLKSLRAELHDRSG